MDKWLNLSKNIAAKDANAMDPGAGVPESSNTTREVSKTVKMKSSCTRKRKYNESFLQYGFTFSIRHDEQQPVCLICNEYLANESMKPAKLKRHFDTRHAAYSNKPIEYFERLLKASKAQKQSFEKHAMVQEKYLIASYEASYLIANVKKPYTIGEELVLPIAVRITEIIHGKKYANELRKIPLSNDTVAKRISEISDDQFQQLIGRIKESSKFAIQLDESTDITNSAQLLGYVRYCYDNSVHEDLLFCRSLDAHTTGEDIFLKVDEFFKEVGLEWNNCIGVCTDGASSMTGRNVGFQVKVKSASNGPITFTHCMIHREALVAKKISSDLNSVIQDAVKVINFIKSRALNSRLFANLCKDMGSDFNKLLLHSEVRWLSKGRALRRLLDLKNEVIIFLSESNSDFAELFHNENWLCKLYYLSDIFDKLNELNLSLQGENTNIFILKDKIQAFMKKITIWKARVENDLFGMFSSMDDFISENNLSSNPIKQIIIDHLVCLESHFHKYFLPDFKTDKFDWVQNPFIVEMDKMQHLSLMAQEEFAELSSDSNLKLEFSKKNLNAFWLGVKVEFPLLSELAMTALLPFVTTYLCESAFSTLTAIKTKYRSSLQNIEMALRPALTSIKPRFDLLSRNKQAHPSH